METSGITGFESVPAAAKGGVLTIGNFDGVHRGHRRIIETCRALASADGVTVTALTFEPPPDQILRPSDLPERIIPLDLKVRLLKEAGADYVVVADTHAGLLKQTPEQFIAEIIVGRFTPRNLVEGPDFFFGRKRAGNVEVLRQAGAAGGFILHVVEPAMVELPDGPQRVSSTLIRQRVMDGRVEDAAECLGRPFALYERIVAGAGRGRLLDFPTVNLHPGQQVVPGDGVYAGIASLDGRRFAAAISVGNKPTLGPAEHRIVEAFLLDARGDFYHRELELSFLRRLREQRRFDGAEPLKAQIAKDVQRVREICAKLL